MSYANGPLATSSYNIIGKTTISVMSWSPDMTRIKISGPESQVFYNHKPGDKLPKIVEGESAFAVEVMNCRHSVAMYILLVKKVIEYEVKKSNIAPDTEDAQVDITIEFEKINTDYRRDDIVTIEPVVTGIVQLDRWLIVMVEGNTEARSRYTNIKYFRHGDSVYFVHDTQYMKYILGYDIENPVTATTVMIASTNELENKDDVAAVVARLDTPTFSIFGRYNRSKTQLL